MLGSAVGCEGGSSSVNYPPALTPILEAVVRSGPVQTVIARNTGGEFEVLPARAVILHVRAPWPAGIELELDGVQLERVSADNIARKQQLDAADAGYYESNVTDPDPRDAHWELAVSPPPSKRQSGSFSLQIRSVSQDSNATGTDKRSDPLVVRVIATGASGFVEASDMFFDGGDNSKIPGAIVARDVVLAGWLANDMPLENCDPTVPVCEDWHYDIFLDPDFIERYYGGTAPRTPLVGAVIPGHPADPVKAVPLADRAPDGTVRGVTVGSFLLPAGIVGHDFRNFTIELNGWHPSARGSVPSGWKSDPLHSDTAWPYDPRDPDGLGQPLKAGDYVVVSGTLWEDGGHVQGFFCEKLGGLFCGNTPGQPFKENGNCWETTTGHSGWLEIHPVDSIVRVREPQNRPRRNIGQLAICVPQELFDTSRTVDVTVKPVPEQPPTATATLKFVELVDGRFTDLTNVDEHTVDVADAGEGEKELRAHVKLHSSGTLSGHGRAGRFKATYLVWWES